MMPLNKKRVPMRSDLQELLGVDGGDDSPEMTLFVSSNYTINRYAIVDEVGETTWHAQLSQLPHFKPEQYSRLPPIERAQLAADAAVARKAVSIRCLRR